MIDDQRIPKFWTCDDSDERLPHTCIEEAVDEFVNNLEKGEPMPDTLEVFGFAPMEPDADRGVRYVMEWLLESLDEEYGDPNQNTSPTDAMKAAAKTFVEAVLAEYKVYMCEVVTTRTVNPRDYVAD